MAKNRNAEITIEVIEEQALQELEAFEEQLDEREGKHERDIEERRKRRRDEERKRRRKEEKKRKNRVKSVIEGGKNIGTALTTFARTGQVAALTAALPPGTPPQVSTAVRLGVQAAELGAEFGPAIIRGAGKGMGVDTAALPPVIKGAVEAALKKVEALAEKYVELTSMVKALAPTLEQVGGVGFALAGTPAAGQIDPKALVEFTKGAFDYNTQMIQGGRHARALGLENMVEGLTAIGAQQIYHVGP